MKKATSMLLIGALAVAMVGSLTACGASEEPTAPEEVTGQAPEEVAEAAADAAEEEIPAVNVDEVTGDEYIVLSSDDGAVTLEVPNNMWRTAPTDEACAAFSDGDCVIFMNHYPADTTPALSQETETYPYVFEEYYAGGTYKIVLTGYATNEADYWEMVDIVKTAKVDMEKAHSGSDNAVAESNETTQEAPKAAPEEHKVDPSSYSVTDTSATKYCTVASLTIRAEGTSDASSIGAYAFNEAVTVTGIVLKNGVDNGWVRVNKNGMVGYVASCYLADQAQTATKSGETLVLNVNEAVTAAIYKYTDGTWRDDSGVKYTQQADGNWKGENGTTLFYYNVNKTQTPTKTGEKLVLNVNEAVSATIYKYTDGTWRDDAGVKYTQQADGNFKGENGTTLFYFAGGVPQSQAPTKTGAALVLQVNEGVSTSIYEYTDGTWKDDAGVRYTQQPDGNWKGDNGTTLFY